MKFISVIKFNVINFFIGFLFKSINSKTYKTLEKEYFTKVVLSKLKKCGSNIQLPFDSIILNPEFISIGDNFFGLKNIRIEAWDKYGHHNYSPHINIGNNVIVNTDFHIGCISNITIKDNVLIASRVFITDHYHGEISSKELDIVPSKRRLWSKGDILINENVWIGEGVCIMPNVEIGENTIIGANSVVTKSFGPNLVIGGNPARIIKNI